MIHEFNWIQKEFFFFFSIFPLSSLFFNFLSLSFSPPSHNLPFQLILYVSAYFILRHSMEGWDTTVNRVAQCSLSPHHLGLAWIWGKWLKAENILLCIILPQASALCHKVDAQKYSLNLTVIPNLSGLFSFY